MSNVIWRLWSTLWRHVMSKSIMTSPRIPGPAEGCQGWHHIGSVGPNWDKFENLKRSVSVHFGSVIQNVLKLILKSPRFVSFGANLTPFRCQKLNTPATKTGITSGGKYRSNQSLGYRRDRQSSCHTYQYFNYCFIICWLTSKSNLVVKVNSLELGIKEFE